MQPRWELFFCLRWWSSLEFFRASFEGVCFVLWHWNSKHYNLRKSSSSHEYATSGAGRFILSCIFKIGRSWTLNSKWISMCETARFQVSDTAICNLRVNMCRKQLTWVCICFRLTNKHWTTCPLWKLVSVCSANWILSTNLIYPIR
jgi:hypothetical protein